MGCRALMSWCVIAAKRARSTDSMSASGAEKPEQPKPPSARLPRMSVLLDLADHAAYPAHATRARLILRRPWALEPVLLSSAALARKGSVQRESGREARIAEGASPARKRSGNSNGRPFARRRLGRATASSGEWWPFLGHSIHRRGAARTAPDLSGNRTEGRQAPSMRACRPVRCGSVLQPEDRGTTHTTLRTASAARARASSISAAGTCPCSTPRRSRSTTPCAARRACLTSRTCASLI